MKRCSLLFFILLFTSFARPLFCMKSTSEKSTLTASCYTSKTPIPGARCALFLSPTKIAVAGNTGCSFIDLYPTEKIIPLSHLALIKHSVSDIATNSDKSLCAISGNGCISIFNTKNDFLNHQIDLNTHSHTPLTFNPHNSNHLFYRSKSELYTTKSHLLSTTLLQKHNKGCPLYIACHPKKKEIIECGSRQNAHCYSCYSYNPIQDTPMVSYKSYDLIDTVCTEYNNRGDFLAINTIDQGFYIQKNNNESLSGPYRSDDEKRVYNIIFYPSLLFHPNNTVLIALNYKYEIEYWDCSTGNHICTTSLPFSGPRGDNCNAPKRLAISPNGRNALIALLDKFFITDIPFTAIFQGDVRKKIITIYCALKTFAEKNTIPHDIVNLLMSTYWNCDYAPITHD